MSYSLGSSDAGERGEFYPETGERQARPRFRAIVAVLVGLVVIGVFAGGLWFAYLQGLRHASGDSGEVPLIRADERPTKVKPENPGGMEIPDRDKLIFTQKRATVEHLLPPPEKPMALPTAPPGTAAQPGAPQQSAAPASTQTAAAAAPGVAPAGKPQLPAAKPGAKPGSGALAASTATAAQSHQAKTAATRIQLGSVRSEDAARQEWERIKRANSDLLGSLAATPIRADLGDKGVYFRIQTTPTADAERICGELKRRNVGCIIVR